ncbi:head protein [Photobacterium phosphoreum]|uniref:Head protein n=1 Tax=Photobacterium phosphoreum TaxID=659 RepID=A0AAW4ZSW8_PHOPO|nr:head completion/stabilization protein [Photobacterium phosphoreum]MCD9491345.1 head protein [Photobacterium phosphoreum]MCD9502384.1 head protein [Photobacterium phosphoreum]MCF2190611.1 head protein [Photobacterium phosphoreum]MCF2302202.1 head protein [Photobacterium phosphoreum]
MFQDIKTLDTAMNDTVENDGFWPNLSITDFVKTCRIPPVYNAEQECNMLIMAMSGVNIELNSFKERAIDNNQRHSSDIGMAYGTESATTVQYKQAVYQRAKASLLVHFATLSRKDEAENLAKESTETNESLMALSQHAIRNILGMPMATVRLL